MEHQLSENESARCLNGNMEQISSNMGSMAAAIRKALLAVSISVTKIQHPLVDLSGFKSKIFIR